MTAKGIPSRRKIMRMFGTWLDWMEFAHEVRLGKADPPEGSDFGDMVRTGIGIKDEYEAMSTAYIRKEPKTEI